MDKFIYRMMETVECQQVISQTVLRDLLQRQESRIAELERLGFSYLCCYSESFAASRLLFILPALVVLVMWLKREIIKLRHGKIHTHYLLMISRDNAIYAHAFGMGIKFHSSFTDGTFLVTANFAGDDIECPFAIKHYLKGSIPDAYAHHQRSIEALEAAGKHANRQASFSEYADISARETAAWLASA